MWIPNGEERGRREAGAPPSNSALRRVKEFPHGWGGGGISGERVYAKTFEHQAEDTLMLVEGDGFVCALGKGADHDGGYVATTGSEVESVGFVEDDDEKAILLKLRA